MFRRQFGVDLDPAIFRRAALALRQAPARSVTIQEELALRFLLAAYDVLGTETEREPVRSFSTPLSFEALRTLFRSCFDAALDREAWSHASARFAQICVEMERLGGLEDSEVEGDQGAP